MNLWEGAKSAFRIPCGRSKMVQNINLTISSFYMWWEAPNRVAMSWDKRLRTDQISRIVWRSNRAAAKKRQSVGTWCRSGRYSPSVAVHYVRYHIQPHARTCKRGGNGLCCAASASVRFCPLQAGFLQIFHHCELRRVYRPGPRHRNYLALSVWVRRAFIYTVAACIRQSARSMWPATGP